MLCMCATFYWNSSPRLQYLQRVWQDREILVVGWKERLFKMKTDGDSSRSPPSLQPMQLPACRISGCQSRGTRKKIVWYRWYIFVAQFQHVIMLTHRTFSDVLDDFARKSWLTVTIYWCFGGVSRKIWAGAGKANLGYDFEEAKFIGSWQHWWFGWVSLKCIDVLSMLFLSKWQCVALPKCWRASVREFS